MKAVILQPFGIGDQIFTITICNLLIADGYHVIYPTQPHFVEGLQRAYPQIEWVNCNEFKADYNCKVDKEINGIRHIPLRWSDGWNGTPYRDCMANKYKMYDLDWQSWRDGAMWQMDSKEDRLLEMFGGVDEVNKYVLKNMTFGSEMKQHVPIRLEDEFSCENPNGKHVINMDGFGKLGYSLFDWAKVLENVGEIHTVSTSIIYILEMLDLKAKEVHLYNRPIAGQGFDNIDYILTKHKYIFHA